MDAKKLGLFIAQQRKELNMTQADLAEKLFVTDKAVSRWERGLGLPDINTLEPLAEALHLSVLEIIKAEKDETPVDERIDHSIKEVVEMADQEKKKIKKDMYIRMVINLVILLFVSYLYIQYGEQYKPYMPKVYRYLAIMLGAAIGNTLVALHQLRKI